MCNILWTSSLRLYFQTHLERIFSLQKKILKRIYFKSQRSNTEELFETSDVISIYDLFTVELLKFLILSMLSKCPTEELNSFFRIRSSASLLTRSIETEFYGLPSANSVKLKSSLKHRGARLLNHLLGRNISFVGLKINRQVSRNLSKYMQNLVVAHKLSELVFDVTLY